MSNSLLLELTAIVILVLLNGFFALAEFSIIASRKSRLQQNVKHKMFGAGTAARLRERPEQFLASIQVGITFAASMLGVFSGATVVNKLNEVLHLVPVATIQQHSASIAVAVVVVGITNLAVVVGELVPKYVALSNPERFARYIAGPTALFVKLSFVFSQVLSAVARGIVRLLGIRHSDTADAVSEEEINQMLVDGRQKGLFEETEEQFIRAVFEFTDAAVRRAMKPRTDVIAVGKNTSVAQVMALVAEHGYSRYPVYDESIDHVIGVLHVKDLINKAAPAKDPDITSCLREPLFVPDSMPLPKLLKLFQSGRNHLAIVLDEFGGTAGIVTLEDILEELVGEIRDEYDVEAPAIVKMSDRMLYAEGSARPGEINQILHVNLPEDEADTVAGLFMDTAGHIPGKNESIAIADTRLTVLARRDNRILRLKIEKTT